MKNIFKILSVILALALVLSFAACNKSEDEDDNDKGGKVEVTTAGKTSVEEWVEEKGDELLDMLDSMYGEQAECSISADGYAVTIDIKMFGINDVPDDQKEMMQEMFDEMAPEMKDAFAGYEDELPELEEFVFNVMEEDGDDLASFTIEF